jgi:oligopeptide/dipeptide ABC transporter ATP-binding protein
MIAMALVTKPKVLLADEPTTALDVTIQAQILSLMRDLQRDFDTAIVLITHNLGVVNQLADEIAVMYAGQIVEKGPRREVLASPSHPYTRGLLGALPGRSIAKTKLHEIKGTVPSPKEWPSGCRFENRCPEAEARCRLAPPALTAVGGSDVACFLRGSPARGESPEGSGKHE